MGCPREEELRTLLAGDAAPDGALARHLEGCAACRRTLDRLAGLDDSWPAVARCLKDGQAPAPPALERVVAELCVPAGETLAPDPAAGGKLGHYEVGALVGQGGMGRVYRAFDPALHRVVAIKVMAEPLAASGPARQRFLREARAAAAVVHEHVVVIHAVEGADAVPYLVMQFVSGMSLQDRIDRDGALPLKDVLRIGMQAASGLAAAHRQGLVHRDIKPANILLENGVERVKITDFGLARAVDDASLTQSGVIAGTPQYMSPEQANGEPVDHRSDLFSLGSVIYAMATGHPPFRAGSTVGVLRRVAEASPRPLREANPELPRWLEKVVARLMAKDPRARFQGADEVAEVLGKELAGLQAETGPETPRSPKPKRRLARRVGAAVALALVVALAWATWAVWPGKKPDGGADPPGTPPVAVAPFDGALAARHQREWAGHLGTGVETANSLRMKLVLVPPGEFDMGATPAEMAALAVHLGPILHRRLLASAGPRHRVRITRPFLLGADEVTIGQFKEFVRQSRHRTDAEKAGRLMHWRLGPVPGRSWRNPGHEQTDDFPVVGVSWGDAVAFCAWLSAREKRRYRLPSEAEWEYACRAGTTGPTGFGEALTRGQAVTGRGEDGRPEAVGGRQGNAFGLRDMHGNAWEWCADWYGEHYYHDSPTDDPPGPRAGTDRVLRGLAFDAPAARCVSFWRFHRQQAWGAASIGFRVACDAPATGSGPRLP